MLIFYSHRQSHCDNSALEKPTEMKWVELEVGSASTRKAETDGCNRARLQQHVWTYSSRTWQPKDQEWASHTWQGGKAQSLRRALACLPDLVSLDRGPVSSLYPILLWNTSRGYGWWRLLISQNCSVLTDNHLRWIISSKCDEYSVSILFVNGAYSLANWTALKVTLWRTRENKCVHDLFVYLVWSYEDALTVTVISHHHWWCMLPEKRHPCRFYWCWIVTKAGADKMSEACGSSHLCVLKMANGRLDLS